MYAASASVYKIEAKGKDLCEVQFFGKFIMCSNNEDTPVLIEPGETRYWVRKINPLKNDDTSFLQKLITEIPAFLYFLQHRQLTTDKKAECSSVRNRYYLPIVELLEEKKYQGIVSSIRKRLTTIGQQLVALANTIGVNSKKKIELKKELDIIEKDMNTNSVDDPSLAELLSNNKQLLEHVKEQKIFPGRKEGFKGNNPQQRQTSPRTIGAVQQSDILSEDPEATKNGLSLYLT